MTLKGLRLWVRRGLCVCVCVCVCLCEAAISECAIQPSLFPPPCFWTARRSPSQTAVWPWSRSGIKRDFQDTSVAMHCSGYQPLLLRPFVFTRV